MNSDNIPTPEEEHSQSTGYHPSIEIAYKALGLDSPERMNANLFRVLIEDAECLDRLNLGQRPANAIVGIITSWKIVNRGENAVVEVFKTEELTLDDSDYEEDMIV